MTKKHNPYFQVRGVILESNMTTRASGVIRCLKIVIIQGILKNCPTAWPAVYLRMVFDKVLKQISAARYKLVRLTDPILCAVVQEPKPTPATVGMRRRTTIMVF